MYKFFSLLLVLLTIVIVNCEYISPHKKSPNCANFCERIECEPIKDCKDGFILENGSYCECCNACVKYLDTGQPCNKILKGSLALVAQSRCKPGTECINGKCTLVSKVTFECLRQKNFRERIKGTGMYKEDIWIPQCDIDGTYAAKQKKMRKSVCVDESGNAIFGSADDDLENTCACSRYMLKKKENESDAYNTKPQEHCSPSGSFVSLQCIGDLCYCADKNTGQVNSNLVTRNFLDKLPCYDKDSQTKNYLTDCEIELQRSRKLVYDFKKKGMELIGADRIKCDPDGTFSPVQRTLTRYYCTDKEGVGIKSYHPEIKRILETDINMSCNCAREDKYQHNSMFSCTEYGNYEPLTCVGNHCVCVDDDGDIISEKSSKELKKEICDKLLQNLKSETIEDIDETTNEDKDETTEDYYDPDDYNDDEDETI